MIELSAPTAVVVASSVAVGTGVWGASAGVGSVLRGPEWTLRHLRRSAAVAIGVAGTGVLTTFWVHPIWLGLAVAYVGLVTTWLARRVSKSLRLALALGGFESPPRVRRSAILRRVSRALILGALVVAVLATLDAAWRGWPALFDYLLVLVLLVPAVIYRRQARSPAA